MEFSYSQYREIIRNIKDSGKYADYTQTAGRDRFIVLRHDVEFTPQRAYQMAKLEQAEGISTSYFFQLRNHSYNILSKTNRRLVRALYGMGHRIGLHVHAEGLTCIQEIAEMILLDVKTLSDYLDIPIDRYSFHRPDRDVLAANLKLDGLINVYDARFFHYKEKIESLDELAIRYMADSMHRWNYGFPDRETLNNIDKIQLLIHPYSWTEGGLDNRENFRSLLAEKDQELKMVFASETKHFAEVCDEL